MTTVSSFLDGLHDPEALPPLTDVNRRYFAAAACGVLVFQRCANGHPFLYPRLVCPVCYEAELAWETAAGTGEIVSFAPVYRRPWDSFPRNEPYVVVLVQLDEGPRLLASLEDAAPDEVVIGARVRAVFERVNEDLGLVRFRPAAS